MIAERQQQSPRSNGSQKRKRQSSEELVRSDGDTAAGLGVMAEDEDVELTEEGAGAGSAQLGSNGTSIEERRHNIALVRTRKLASGVGKRGRAWDNGLVNGLIENDDDNMLYHQIVLGHAAAEAMKALGRDDPLAARVSTLVYQSTELDLLGFGEGKKDKNGQKGGK